MTKLEEACDAITDYVLMEALTANVNPTELYVSDDILVTDSYFFSCILQLEKKWSRMLNGNTYWIV